MHDIKIIRDNPNGFDLGLAKRGLPPQALALIALDEARRNIIARLQAQQERRNAASKEIGLAMGKGDKAKAEALKAEVTRIKDGMPVEEEALKQAEASLHITLAAIPNLPAEDVPEGPDETANVEIRRHGKPRGLNAARQHFEIGETMGLMDFETATKISGSRFVVLKGALAQLERALGNYMIDLHTREHGYTEIEPPFLVNTASLTGTGNLPKFEADLFKIAGEWDLYLVPTAEVPLTNMHRGEILDGRTLPIRYTAYTPCFRSEAGSYGADVRGLIRQHQFDKVELMAFSPPDKSYDELERLTGNAEEVLNRLDLPYRRVLLCSGDMGFASAKTYDLEVWLPGQNTYREISSCSNTEAFQARRANIKFRPEGSGKAEFVHTLNGSGLAVGRTLIAILENYQQTDGSVAIPEALRPFMNGASVIRRL